MYKEQQSLTKVAEEPFLEGKFKWGPIPLWKNQFSSSQISANKSGKDVGSGSDNNTVSVDKEKEKEKVGEWREAVAPTGQVYYW